MLHRRFKEYFTFTRKERNGVITLILVLLVIVAFNILINKNLKQKEPPFINEKFKKEVELFEKSLKPKNNSYKLENTSKSAQQNSWFIPAKLFKFDPNKVSKSELGRLGFSYRQIRNIIKYREKGGRFYSKKDLLKIYGIEEKQYNSLEPFVIIKTNKSTKEKKQPETKTPNNTKIEINSATKEDLIKLKGIGKVYAERIIKYRKLLGGFYKKEQLLEVYGLDTLCYLKFNENIFIDKKLLKKININKAGYKHLIRHPYLNKYQVESILKYKELSGKFNNIEQVFKNNLLNKETFLKVKPYLKIE